EVLRRLLRRAERLSEAATALGLRSLNTLASRSRALLVRVTCCDHFFRWFLAVVRPGCLRADCLRGLPARRLPWVATVMMSSSGHHSLHQGPPSMARWPDHHVVVWWSSLLTRFQQGPSKTCAAI